MQKRSKSTLIRYMFGNEDKLTLSRLPLFFTGIPTIIFFILFSYTLYFMEPIEWEVYPNPKFKPRITKDKVINSYQLKIKNKKDIAFQGKIYIVNIPDYSLVPAGPIEIKPGITTNKIIYLLLPDKAIASEGTKKLLLYLDLNYISNMDFMKDETIPGIIKNRKGMENILLKEVIIFRAPARSSAYPLPKSKGIGKQ